MAIFAAIEGGAGSGPVSRVLVSSGSAHRFGQRPGPTLFGDWRPAFVSATDGIAIGQPDNAASMAVHYTTDAGVSWSPSDLPATRLRVGSVSFGAAEVVGSLLYLPVSRPASGGGRRIQVSASSDGGRRFGLVESHVVSPVRRSGTAAPTRPGRGPDLWVLPGPGGSVAVSADGATGSKTVAGQGFHSGVVAAEVGPAVRGPPGCRPSAARRPRPVACPR